MFNYFETLGYVYLVLNKHSKIKNKKTEISVHLTLKKDYATLVPGCVVGNGGVTFQLHIFSPQQ